MTSNSSSKYDMRCNPVYQIDWTSTASGKRLSATKRRVRFRFGFSNRDAIANGLTGNECRGEEHEVNLTWSLTSGKSVVIFDGQQIHFSVGRRGDAKFETSWSIQGGHMLKIVAHAAPPLRATPGFKQFDLMLDGLSYFAMPRIYELGVQKQHGRPVATAVNPQSFENGFAYKNRDMSHYERDHGMQSFSSFDSRPQNFAVPVRRSTVVPVSAPVSATESVVSEPSPVSSVVPEDVLSAASVAPSDLLQAVPAFAISSVDEFTPIQVQPTPPTFQDVSSHILSAYGPPPSTPTTPAPLALANESHTHFAPQTQHVPNTYSPNAAYHQQQQQTYYQGQLAVVSPDGSSSGGSYYPPQAPPVSPVQQNLVPGGNTMVTPTMTMMKPLDVNELRDSPPPENEVDRAVCNLVNFDDLMETKTTPEQLKSKKQKEAMKTHNKSVAKPPATTTWHVSENASLMDIQVNKTKAPTSKEIMRMHAFDPAAAQAGMMVCYGQQAPLQGAYAGGIPASNEFGVGAHRGYSQPYPVRSAY